VSRFAGVDDAQTVLGAVAIVRLALAHGAVRLRSGDGVTTRS
jgi:hypothetical protein